MSIPLTSHTPCRGYLLGKLAKLPALFFILTALLLASCGGSKGGFPKHTPPAKPDTPEVAFSGSVIGSATSQAYQLRLEDSAGKTVYQGRSNADGNFNIVTQEAKGPFLLFASPVSGVGSHSQISFFNTAFADAGANGELVAECRDGNPIVCNVTPWSTLAFHYALEHNLSFESALATINGNPWLALEPDEDPFVKWKNNPTSADLDVLSIFEQLQQGKLNEWLAQMRDWLEDSEHTPAPPGLPVLTVTAAPVEGGSVTPASINVRRSDSATLTLTPETGYRVISASGCPGTLNNTVFTTALLEESCELVPVFSKTLLKISYTANTGGTLGGSLNQGVEHGSNGTAVSATPALGYIFSAWSDGRIDNPRIDTGVTEDLSIEAIFIKKIFNLEYTANAGGRIDGAQNQAVNYGENGSSVTAVPTSGFFFVNWSDGSTANPRTDVEVTEPVSVQANFSTIPQAIFTLHYSTTIGGALSGSTQQQIEKGTTGTAVTAVAETGYRFVKWSDDVTANPRTDSNVIANLSVQAIFEKLQFTVTYTAGTEGSLTGTANQTIAHGDNATAIQAVANTGYRFVKWSDDITANPRTDSNIVANLSVQAIFEKLQYTVTYTAGTGGSLTGTANQTIAHGDDATAIQAIADTGYYFLKWSDNTTTNPRTDSNITTNLSIGAIFQVNGRALALLEEYRDELNNRGEVQTLALSNTDAVDAEYLLVPVNLKSDAPLSLSITASGITSAQPGASGHNNAPTESRRMVRRQASLEAFKNYRGSISSGTPVIPAAHIPAGDAGVVGSDFQLNNKLDDQCINGTLTTGKVTFSGDNIIVVHDQSNPAIVMSAPEITMWTNALTILDTKVYPAIVSALGAPSDSDSNGKIVLFVTQTVNHLDPIATVGAANSTVAVYLPRDKLTRQECATSNLGEIIYIMAPDNSGSINNNTRSVSFISQHLSTAVARELAHMIIDGHRIESGSPFEEAWLNEALASMAMERVFYAANSANVPPFSMITLQTLITGPNSSANVAAFNSSANLLFGAWRVWLQFPSRSGLFDNSQLTTPASGQQWAFLRYVTDRHASPDIAKENLLLKRLVDSRLTGMDNLEDVLGEDLSSWVMDYLISAYINENPKAGLLGKQGSKFSTASWNYRSVYGGLGGYDLKDLAFPVNGTVNLTLYPNGSSAYYRFRVPARGQAILSFNAPAGNYDARFSVIRVNL